MARQAPLINLAHPVVRVVRRVLAVLFGVPTALALVLTAVDSYRRRGKKPQPFPRTPPQQVTIGEGTVTTYTYGRDLYDAMLAAIDGAQHQVLLETYIWKGDQVGEEFKEALVRAADRGVEVYAIWDAFANLVVSPRFQRFPLPVRVLAYPVYNAGWRFFDIRRYGRDHRKLLVVDDDTGFVGGYNIGSAYATQWRDTHVRITGPGVRDLKRAFADFWNTQRHVHRSGRLRWHDRGPGETRGSGDRVETTPRPLDHDSDDWESRIRVQRNLPRQWTFPIRSMYLDAIDRARTNVWMTHAYFIPDENFVEALVSAAHRGVDVQVLLPKVSNHVVADWIGRGYFNQLLGAGVRIWRFTGAMVHAKTATIDGAWATVGTANIDRLSMTGNYEINLEFIDRDQAATMEEIFRTDVTNSEELTLETWQRRRWQSRATELALTPLRPFL
ncbi:cardiolipin synthase B [Marmoricola endophyticus]|uniref:Cardiolipin synthase B n=1 Tax=Marmoricola endophyticus TaxID=2040280 RepID=A0A917BBU5_9ACTN|nr:phospholipase D-like domain-containing protein [Marmoricola endophyticus]GGF33086.1 cardiolipin synthase B [Marmoricola endophyticus]